MSVLKQLCMHQFNLPDEILTIIKSYAFNDIFTLQKIRKDAILTLIEAMPWSYRNEDINPYNRFVFWIEADVTCPQYQIDFCIKCGNYKYYCSKQYDTIECNCNKI
jgi:hypothetical protein